jgi:hypothetical protein
MTEQIPHWVSYKDNRYQLMSFFPQIGTMLDKLGIKPSIYSTACRCGYVAEYSIESDQLFLTKLVVENLMASQQEIDAILPSVMSEHPPLGGISPVAEFIGEISFIRTVDGQRGVDQKYSIVYHLEYPCSVSGSFSIVHGRYRRRGPHFEGTVHPQTLKMTVEQGHIQKVMDVTDGVVAVRNALDAIHKEARELSREYINYRKEETSALYRQLHELIGEMM